MNINITENNNFKLQLKSKSKFSIIENNVKHKILDKFNAILLYALISIGVIACGGGASSSSNSTTPTNPNVIAKLNSSSTVSIGQNVSMRQQITNLSETIYTWKQITGSPVLLAYNSDNTEATFIAPTVISNTPFAFQITAKLGNQTSIDTIVVTVSANPASVVFTPISVVADLGADLAISSGQQVILEQKSQNPVNTIYMWMQIFGPNVIMTPNVANTQISFVSPISTTAVTLVFQLKVLSPDGISTDVDTIIVSMTPPNSPVADAGIDQSVLEGTSVTLGVMMSNPSSTIYSWQQTSGLPIILSAYNVMQPVFLAPATSSTKQASFRLTVTNIAGVAVVDDVLVTIRSSSIVPSNAGADLVVSSTEIVSLSAVGNYPADTLFEWTQKNGSVTILINNDKALISSFVAPTIATSEIFEFQLKITTPWLTSSTDSVLVEVRSLTFPNAINLQKTLASSLYVDWSAQAMNFASTQRSPTLLSYQIVGQPSKGTISNLDASTGSFVYSPTVSFQGIDTITYRVVNTVSGASSVATLKIISDEFSLTIPEKLFAVQDSSFEIYFDNIVLDAMPYDGTAATRTYRFDISSNLSNAAMQNSAKWAYTPVAADVGLKTLNIKIIDNTSNNILMEKTSILYVAEKNPDLNLLPTNTKILMIGDSITATGDIAYQLYNRFNPANHPAFKFLGKVNFGVANLHVEAYGGNSWTRFAREYYGGVGLNNSPFVYPGNILNFNQYMFDNLGADRPSIVTIQLGSNDIFSADYSYSSLNAKLSQTMFPSADLLISEIQKSLPGVKIAIAANPPPNTRNALFPMAYGTNYTRIGYKKLHHAYLSKMINKYANREFENIYFAYPGLNMDPTNGFDSSSGNSALHPNSIGYNQIGDGYYAWLRSILKR